MARVLIGNVKGPPGPKGEDGKQGLQGPQGNQGPKGDPGPTDVKIDGESQAIINGVTERKTPTSIEKVQVQEIEGNVIYPETDLSQIIEKGADGKEYTAKEIVANIVGAFNHVLLYDEDYDFKELDWLKKFAGIQDE